MSAIIFQFYISHKKPLVILAINSLKLFEVSVVSGKPDSGVWVEQKHSQELVIYLGCTVTPKPFCHCFKQLKIIGSCVETTSTVEEKVSMSIFILCIVLLTPEVNDHCVQDSTNWRFYVKLCPMQIGWLKEMFIGMMEISDQLNKSIVNSHH